MIIGGTTMVSSGNKLLNLLFKSCSRQYNTLLSLESQLESVKLLFLLSALNTLYKHKDAFIRLLMVMDFAYNS